MWRLLASLIFFGSGTISSLAHDPGISTGQGVLRGDVLEISFGFAPADAQQLLPPEARFTRSWTQAEFETAKAALEALAPQLYEVRTDQGPVSPRSSRVELAPGDALNFHLVYPRPSGSGLTLRGVKLESLPSGHRQFIIVTDQGGSTLTKKLLSAKDNTLQIPGSESGSVAAPGAEPRRAAETDTPFWGFLRLGVEHIWTGYDHLLFLFALLLVCRTFRSIVAIITCFTIAHSLTLALATLNVVNLPARLVEPAIAASIIFVGIENIVRRGEEPRGRRFLTFAFGLIHGFGFAGVLRDLGVGQGAQSISMPLFSFNLGVEVGQILIAAAVLPLVWWARKNEQFVRRGVPGLSALIAAAGLYWLLERTLFS